MNARQMFARYAQGGIVDEVGELRANTGGDVSKARQMLQNLQSPVQHFANGSEVVPAGYRRSLLTNELVPIAATNEQLADIYRGGDAQKSNAAAALAAVQAAAPVNPPVVNPPVVNPPAVNPPAAPISEGLQYATGEGGIGADQYYTNIRNFVNEQAADLNADEIRAEMNKYGVSDKDVRDALAGTQYSAGAVHALLNKDIGAEGAPGRGVGGLEGMSENIRARLEQAQQQALAGTLTKPQVEEFFQTHLGPTGGFNEADLVRATGKTSAQLLAEMQFKGQPPVILPPTDPLPDLPGTFTPPTAPEPQAPPPALTAGAEGLDPGTAIVGKIPESERVKIPQLDTEFRASAPRTPIYDRFGRISGYTYTPAAKLTPATGTNVFNWTPPGITSRPRSLLNLGDVPGVTVDPVTGQLRMPLSASQRFARDRAELDNQFRQLYARAAASDTSLPAQAPAGAAAAFRQFAMSDPTMSAQLRMRDIEQTPTVNPTAAMTAARSQFGQAPYAAALTEAFDPFLARNRAALLATAEDQKGYFERYPDIQAEYEKNWAKTMTPDEYALYHYRTLGQKEGRTAPNLMGSPYTRQFFSKGGEASTEDFIKKQSGGDVSRGTASPETRGVSSLKGYGEGEEAADIRRSAREALRGLVGLEPFDPTNPSEAYRIASTPTPLTMLGAGMAKAIPASKRLLMMPCCDMKGDVPAAAKQLYKGVFYQTYNKQARPGAEPNMVILSAKHGFVEPTKEIAPYNQKMTTKQADELSTNIRSSLDQVQWPTGIEEVMLVGGKEYQKVMRAAIKELQDQGKVSPDVIINATKGEIGEQRSQLGKYLREIPEQEPIEKQDGGEATVEEFISKKADGGDVPRETLPPKLPPGVQRAVDKAQGSRTVLPVPGAGETRQFLSGFVGASPDYSVMDPNYKALGSSYRAGEQAAVASELFGAMTPFATASALARTRQIPGVSQLIAYHGTPKSEVFRAFDPKYIKTGEGNTQYGYGFYFAENPQVSGTYKRMESEYKRMTGGLDPKTERAYDFMAQGLSEPEILSRLGYYYGSELSFDDAMKAVNQAKQHFNVGRLYKVDIDDAKIAKMLDWDAPLGEQSTVIQNLAKQYKLNPDDLGGDLVHAMKAKTPEGAKLMSEAGVPGIKYLDQGSRGLPQIKKQFLEELDPDASTEEVMDLLGKKVFSAKNEALLRELNNNDWLGFDYPSQAISEVFRAGFFRSNPDITEGLKKAVSAARQPDKGTRNIVVFPGEESSIKMLEVDGAPIEKKRGGEVSTKDFIAKFAEGSPNPDEVPSVIDEREEIRSESQRMLNRLASQSKLPPGLQRTIQGARARQGESLIPAAVPARDVMAGMFGAQAMNPGSEAYRTGQALANSPPVEVLKAPAKIASAAGDAATALAAMGPAVGAVIKPKGGNWIRNQPGNYLRTLKNAPDVDQDIVMAQERLADLENTPSPFNTEPMRRELKQELAGYETEKSLNNWIDTKLGKYVKNEMGTPEDPLRKLAERGVLHISAPRLQIDDFHNATFSKERQDMLNIKRSFQGFPEEGFATGDLAKYWEGLADEALNIDKQKDYLEDLKMSGRPENSETSSLLALGNRILKTRSEKTLENNPWLKELDPETPLYSLRSYQLDNLEFQHLIDELRNATNPQSGLPQNLQVDPKKLDRISVPQAVELVDKINKWRVENAGKLRLEETLKADLYKAYPEQKYRWVQLNRPGQFAAESDAMGHSVRGYEPRDKGGSDYYGLGGFKAIESGEAKVYSLRDEKGQPHVTIEVETLPPYAVFQAEALLDPQTKAQYRQYVMEWRRRNPEVEELTDDDITQALREAGVPPEGDRILQIKGKGNAMPTEKYLPFVQDFVRSGNWSEIKDLQNTGLILVQREQNLPGSTKKINPGYYTLDELKQLAVDNNMPQDMLNEWMRRLNAQMRHSAFKDGGEVNVPRETSTSKQQLDKLAQVSQRKKA